MWWHRFRRVSIFIVVCALLGIFACGAPAQKDTAGEPTTRPIATPTFEVIQVTASPGFAESAEPLNTSISCPDCQLVDVLRVIDGDTLDTSIGRLRLFGVDTLERGDVCAADATELTRRLVGSQVRLEDGPRLAVSEFRFLAKVSSLRLAAGESAARSSPCSQAC